MADVAGRVVSAAGGWLQREKAIPRLVFTALGLLLVVTALLKVQGPADGALGQNTILFSPRLRFAVMEAEALLGLWLLSGWAKRPAWLVTVAFFLIVAGFSFYLGLMGQSSCGCFGRIQVSPWNAFALDVACLATLGWVRPSFRRGEGESTVRSPRIREVLTIVGGAVVILTICLAGVLMAGGSRPGDLLARMRGDRLTVEPPVTDMGSDVAGQTRRFTVRLHNHLNRAVKIVGGTANCSCLATDDLPILIPPGESRPITVFGAFKGSPGLFQQEFYFYTDDKDQDRVLARIKGRIIDPSSSQRK
jgi:hypothetical protein